MKGKLRLLHLPLPTFSEEVQRLYSLINDLHLHLTAKTKIRRITLAQLLQGPIADALADVGQLDLLRELSGSPMTYENLAFEEISLANLNSSRPK